jgi:hypothetical protein
MHYFHCGLLTTLDPVSVTGRAGDFGSLTLVLKGNNPRFPWEPSTTMLTYKLNGITGASGFTATNTDQCPPTTSRSPQRIFAPHGAPTAPGC